MFPQVSRTVYLYDVCLVSFLIIHQCLGCLEISLRKFDQFLADDSLRTKNLSSSLAHGSALVSLVKQANTMLGSLIFSECVGNVIIGTCNLYFATSLSKFHLSGWESNFSLLLMGTSNIVLAMLSIAKIVTYPLVGQRLANLYLDIREKLQAHISRNLAVLFAFG
jgi:hypothetical protein